MRVKKTKIQCSFQIAIILAIMITIGFMQISPVHSDDNSLFTKASIFLEQVAELKLEEYKIREQRIIEEVRDTKLVIYNLESNENKLDVHFRFNDDKLVWCKFYSIEGSPIFIQPASKDVDETKNFLNRYQVLSKANYIPPIRNTLDNVNSLTSFTKTVGEINVEVLEIDEKSVSLIWTNTPANIKNRFKMFTLNLQNGVFESFTDWWTLYEIGNTNINVNKAEAIELAKEEVQKHSMVLVGDITVSNFTIADADNAIWTEISMYPREGKALYPRWKICLGLDKVYPGGITQFDVYIWADTAEISSISPIGSYGFSFNNDDHTNQETEEQQESGFLTLPEGGTLPNSNKDNGLPFASYAIVAVISIIIVAVLLILKKKSK